MDENIQNVCLRSNFMFDKTKNNNNNNNNKKNKRICCIGMCVLDIVHVCSNYPVEDTDKRCLKGYMQRGGNASNNCTILRELSYENVEFLGVMSTSKGFEFLPNDCQKRNIIINNCPTVEQDPPFSSVILVENTDSRTIIHSNQNFPIFQYQHFKRISNEFNNYCWIHFEARNPNETIRMQNDICEYNNNNNNYYLQKEKGKNSSELAASEFEFKSESESESESSRIVISVEFEKVFEENLILAAFANYIFLGKDLAMHMGWHDPKEAVYGLRNWMKTKAMNNESPFSCSNSKLKSRPPAIICPWGSIGASSLDEDDNYAFSSAKPPQKIVDALGAGDTFCAATIYALAATNMKLDAAVDFGNFCAGAKLGLYGYDGIAEKVKELLPLKK